VTLWQGQIGPGRPYMYWLGYLRDGRAAGELDWQAIGGTWGCAIVGNSKFYDVMLPVEEIFASMFEGAGFTSCRIDTIRKRTSKKELFEFVVSARKPSRP
jgi:hypothetical protein